LRATWANYLLGAEACGLLDDPDVIARLTGDDDDGFRSALAECAAAWFLKELGFGVKARPDPPQSRGVDLLGVLDELNVYVEVKAPYVPRPTRWAGDDADVLVKCIKDAGNDQFKRGRANILMLVPALRMEIHNNREQLLKATIGQHGLAVPIALDDAPPPPPHGIFLQTGKLARPRITREGAFTTDLTRISAVMSLEPRFRHVSNDLTDVLHSAIVVHNPFARVPIAPSSFRDLPQWVNGDGKMWWTDGYTGP
jgi:hypothetical protein